MTRTSSLIRLAATGALVISSLSAFAFANSGSNPKAVQSFESSFRGASDVKWFDLSRNRSEAKFTVYNAEETAIFDKEGNLLATTRTLDLAAVPMAVTMEINRQFPASEIRYANEIQSNGVTTYLLTLESNSDWKTVSVRNTREVTLVKDLQKTFIP